MAVLAGMEHEGPEPGFLHPQHQALRRPGVLQHLLRRDVDGQQAQLRPWRRGRLGDALKGRPHALAQGRRILFAIDAWQAHENVVMPDLLSASRPFRRHGLRHLAIEPGVHHVTQFQFQP